MTTGKNRLRNANRGITRTPELYDARDIMHHTFKRTVNGSTLLPGIYKGKVIRVRRNIDPNAVFQYEILAWIPEIHTSTPEPKVYTELSIDDIQGMRMYRPISDEVEEPCIGMTVNIFIEDPSNGNGYYHSISSHEFDIRGERYYDDISPKG